MPELEKPNFDPNKPFIEIDSKQKDKPKFNPNEKFTAIDVPTKQYKNEGIDFYADKNVKDKTAKVWGDKEETSFGGELFNSLAKGSAKLGSMLAKTPSMIYDIAAIPFNYVASGQFQEDLQPLPNKTEAMRQEDAKNPMFTSEKFAESVGLGDNKIAKYYNEDVKVRQQQTAQKYDKGISEYFSNGELKKGFGLLANSVAESAPVTISLLMGNAAGIPTAGSILGGGTVFAADKKAELDEQAPHLDQQTKMNIAMSNGLFEGLFEQFGITKLGSLTKNVLLKSGKEKAKKIAKEGFKDVYTPVLKKYLGVSAEESISEAATQFAQNAVDKYSGYKPDLDLKEGVVDAAIIGLGAGSTVSTPAALLEAGKVKQANKEGLQLKKDNISKEFERSEHAFDVVTKGDDAIKEFKQSVDENVKEGYLTPEQAAMANVRIDKYKKYSEDAADLELDESEKKKTFELTFQKENLEAKMEGFGDPAKLSPINKGKYNALEKQAKDLQTDINNIILKEQLHNPETTVVSKKTVEDEIKKDNPPAKKEGEKKPIINPIFQALIDKHARPKEDTRKFEEIPTEEYNKPTFNARIKHAKLTDFLESIPDKKTDGKLVEREYTEGGKKNSTFSVQLPDGKEIRLASSRNRDKNFRGHMRTEHLIEEQDLKDFPVGVKVEYLPEGKKVIKIYNGKTGKFISWAKETNTGKQKPTEAQIEQLDHLQTQIEPIGKSPVNTQIKPLTISNTPTKEEFVSTQINNLLTSQDADVDQDLIDNGTYARYFENQYNKTYGKTNTQSANQEESTSGNNNESNTETVTETDRTETNLKKSRTKDLKIKDASRIKALRLDTFTPYEKVMQYFIGGGTLNSRAFRGLYQSAAEMATNKPLGEIKGRTNYVLPSSKVTVDSLAHDLWEQNPDLKFDVTDYKNAVEEVLNNEPASVIEMAENLLAKNNITNTPQEQELVDVSKQAEANDLLDEFNNGVENLEQLSDTDLTSLADENIELPDDIIRNEDMKDQFQKNASVYGDVRKVVDAIKKALPKIKVKYDENLGGAGKLSADGKTITINPLYAGIDTPIHEAGHVLIDAMGYNDPTIQKATKQLEKSKLWKETKARYPELNTEMLGKEVLAEAIGREGSGIFEKESNITKFQKLLDKIFQWFKDNLGLERNEARVLAKRILRGEASDLAGTNTGKEQYQKESSISDAISDLKQIVAELKRTDLSEDDINELKSVKKNIKEDIEDSDEFAQLEAIEESESLEDFTLDELIESYNFASSISNLGFGQKITDPVKKRIAYFFNEHGKEILRTNNSFIETEANKKDMTWKEVNFKVLSHMTESFPELQQLSPLFDEAYFNKVSEANTMKRQLEKLAKAVIKEHNKKLGIGERALSFFSSDNAKYFNYLDDGGKLKENTNGLSMAQIALLDHMKELLEKRNAQVDENGDLIQNEILKIDRGFAEEFKTEGIMSALSNYFGGSNLADAKIAYTNPTTKQTEESTYLDAQKAILDYSKAGLKEKVVGLGKLLAIAYKAKKSIKGKPAYGLNYKGALTNKFDKARNKDLGYSKDFYRAAQMFIDDYTHTKHFSKFVPIVNSLDYLYSKGYGEVLKKPNAKKWLEDWSQAQIYQTEKTTDPIIDSSLKFLRTLTSQVVMGFNLVANIMNVAIGTYNTWRAENLSTILKGNKRLFYKNGLSKQGIDLLDKYNVVNLDVDSNPGFTAGKLFERIAFGGQKYGEMQIQGSTFLGKLSDEDWDSFERNDKGELVVKKDVDEKALTKRINDIKNEISDIQGKYSDKDRRNFARGEFGKNLAQFKTWMPDWWRVRYGAEYIDGNGKTQRGTWNMFTKDAMAEIKKDFSAENNYGFEWEKGKFPTLKNKQIASNLKGAMVVAFMLAASWGDDEDKEKRKKALSLNNALGNLLFIFDIDQMKYTIKNPVASIGTINKFIDVLDDVIKKDSDEFMKDSKKLIPYNKIKDVPEQVEQIKDIVK
jgi:hypothetical protein